MDPDRLFQVALPVLALLATNAFFVTAEYALLTLERGRLEPNGRDPQSIAAASRLEEVLLLAQLGRSISTLGLGYAIVRLGLAASPPRSGTAATGVVLGALSVGAVVHAVLSAQLPKLIGSQNPGGRISQFVIAVVRFAASVLRPVVWPLARIVGAVASRLGIPPLTFQPLVHTPDDIRVLVTQGHEHGVVEEDEREMIRGVFDFSQTVAREVMTPRIDIVSVPVQTTLDEVLDVLISEGHSRLPVYEGTIDSVVGVLLAKDLLPLIAHPESNPKELFDVRRVMREPYFVPDTKPVDDILAEFRQQSVHLAIVLDEFGGTYGLLTMEDLLEEIVGEINDEYDIAEPDFTPTPEGDVLIPGGASISEVNERFALSLPEEDFDTIGGYIFGALGRIPVVGDEIGGLGEKRTIILHVEETEDRRVTCVRLTRAGPVAKVAREG